jgi:hypothetical protein
MTLLSPSPCTVPADAVAGVPAGAAGPGPLADVVGAGLEVPLVTGGRARYANRLLMITKEKHRIRCFSFVIKPGSRHPPGGRRPAGGALTSARGG